MKHNQPFPWLWFFVPLVIALNLILTFTFAWKTPIKRGLELRSEAAGELPESDFVSPPEWPL